MLITMLSPFTDGKHSFDIPITDEQLARWKSGIPLQQVAPHLDRAQREFLMTGIAPDEWSHCPNITKTCFHHGRNAEMCPARRSGLAGLYADVCWLLEWVIKNTQTSSNGYSVKTVDLICAISDRIREPIDVSEIDTLQPEDENEPEDEPEDEIEPYWWVVACDFFSMMTNKRFIDKQGYRALLDGDEIILTDRIAPFLEHDFGAPILVDGDGYYSAGQDLFLIMETQF